MQEFNMLRKIILAVTAVGALALLSPTDASARGGFGGGGGFRGGGFHGGGFHGGGFHGGGGWRGGGWRGPAIGLGVGLGLAGAYGAYGGYGGYGYGYPASYGYGGDDGCYVSRRRVWTNYGWRVQPVQICGY